MQARMRSTAVAAVALIAAVALLHFDIAAAAYIDLQLEQSFGGKFLPAGTLKGDLDGQGFGGLELQRTAWAAEHTAKFVQLARDDGFYRLRLGGSSGGHVLASARARCLAASGFQERLALHVGSDGSVTGLQYAAETPGGCLPGLPLAEGQLQSVAPSTTPHAVAVVQPASAPRILLADYLPPQHPAGAVGAPTGLPLNIAVQPQVQRQGQDQQQGPDGDVGSGKQGKQAPKPDERTWIQKNWLFLLPIGLIIFNQLGGLAAPQQGGAAAGGGGS